MVEEKINNNILLKQNFTNVIPIIFGFLEAKQIIKCNSVCHLWKKSMANITILDNDDMYKLLLGRKLNYSTIKHLDLNSFNFESLSKLINLQTIIIQFNYNLCDDNLQIIAQMKKLKNLSLSYCPNITAKGLNYILKSNTKLETLELLGNNITDCIFSYIRKSNIKLQSLMLTSSNITNEGLLSLKEHNVENLHTFSIKSCYKITDDGLIHILKIANKLKKLDIGHCSITDDSFDFFPESLRVLSAIDCKFLNFKNPIKLNNLEVLELRNTDYIHNIHDGTIKHIVPYLTNLKRFNLSQCSITDNSLRLLAILPNLEYLNVDFCKNITLNGLEYIDLIIKQTSKKLFVKADLNRKFKEYY
jgi:hypothetical protein